MNRLFLGLGLLFISGCICTDTYYCPDLSPAGRAIVRMGNRDTMSFADSSGNLRFDFEVSYRKFKPPYMEECSQGDFNWKCYCNDCMTYGNFRALSFSSGAEYPFYYDVWVTENPAPGEKQTGTRSIDFRFMDFVSTIWYEDSTYSNSYLPPIVHHETLMLNGKQFQDIFVFEIDTLKPNSSNQDVWRVYFSNTQGVVGFVKRFPPLSLTLTNP